MSFTAVLLNVLNDDKEPLPKRLKIADNAFNSFQCSIPRKEVFLVDWLSKKLDNDQFWKILEDWLNSEHFKKLGRNEIDGANIITIAKIIVESLNKKHSSKTDLFDLLLNLLNHKISIQYFAHNLEQYCTFVCALFNYSEIQCKLVKLLGNEELFHESIRVQNDFYSYFLSAIFPSIVKAVEKSANNTEIYNEACKLLQKCIFRKNQKLFLEYFKVIFGIDNTQIEEGNVPKGVFEILNSFKNSSSTAFKLMFSAFLKTYNNDELAGQFFILLTEMIGFDTSSDMKLLTFSKFQSHHVNLNVSLGILETLLRELNNSNINWNVEVANIKFCQFIQNLIVSVFGICKQPNRNVYNILSLALCLDPLLIEKITNEFAIYAMLGNNENLESEYENLLKKVFEIFVKLHRMQNFVSKIVPTLKAQLSKEHQQESSVVYRYRGKVRLEQGIYKYDVERIFPAPVLNYFTECVTQMASWQVMNLFMTLLFHLEGCLDIISITDNDQNFVYFEILCLLMSWLLRSVRMAENTVTVANLEKFVKGLEDLKILLGRLGLAFLNKEYNQVLMRGYLELCYNWGELYITIVYYSINNEIVIKKAPDQNSFASNITYIHSYLDTSQWCLISERIANFGQPPCSYIMFKLFAQKIKSMLMFEDKVPEEMLRSLAKVSTDNLEGNWREIVKDNFIVPNITKRMESHHLLLIAEKLIEADLQREYDISKNMQILDDPILLNALVYAVLMKINKTPSRSKRKSESGKSKSLSNKFFATINPQQFIEGIFISNSDLVQENLLSENESDSDVDWKGSSVLLFELLRKLPIVFASNTVQEVTFLNILCLHKNYRSCGIEESCEKCLIGILQNVKFDVVNCLDPEVFTNYVLNNTRRREEIFSHFLDNVFRREESVIKFDKAVGYLANNISNLKLLKSSLILLNEINKIKKSKFSKEVKDTCNVYKTSLLSKIEKLLLKKDVSPCYIESYAVTLKAYLSKNYSGNSVKSKLSEYTACAMNCPIEKRNEIRGITLLYSTIFHHKTELGFEDSNFAMAVWKKCKTWKSLDNSSEFSQLLALIAEHVSIDDFPEFTNDILNLTIEAIREQNYSKLKRQLFSWSSILTCSFNSTKTSLWQTSLESLLIVLDQFLHRTDWNEEIVDHVIQFETSVIQHNQLLLTPTIIGILILRPSTLIRKKYTNFVISFGKSVLYLDVLLKYRQAMILDRLPPFLQQYRALLCVLCDKSESTKEMLEDERIIMEQLADCAHQMEKLTKQLVSHSKHMVRISPYLIADILNQYEQHSLYPNVKIHLNNCIYSLISLCDQHAVSYLMRVLSGASTEIFKLMYNNYKKYYRFTGKV